MLFNSNVMVKIPIRFNGLEIQDIETLRKEIHPDVIQYVRDTEMNVLFRFLKSREFNDMADQVKSLQQRHQTLTDAQVFEGVCTILDIYYDASLNAMYFDEHGQRFAKVESEKENQKSPKNDYKDLKNMIVQVKVFQATAYHYFFKFNEKELHESNKKASNKALKELNAFLQTIKQEQVISIQSETTSQTAGNSDYVAYESKLILTYRCPLNEIESE